MADFFKVKLFKDNYIDKCAFPYILVFSRGHSFFARQINRNNLQHQITRFTFFACVLHVFRLACRPREAPSAPYTLPAI